MIVSPLLPSMGGYIDGQWVMADEGKAFPVINPATGEVLAQVARMGANETRRAIDAASLAMHGPAGHRGASGMVGRDCQGTCQTSR
jgi:NAD-dependent aldehyde dehydrogenases